MILQMIIKVRKWRKMRIKLGLDYPASSGFSRPVVTLRWERNHCKQPFAFPSSRRVHVMTTNIQREDATRTSTKAKQQLCTCTLLFLHFFAIFARLQREDAKFCVLCITWTSNDEIYSPFRSWTWIWSLGIQLHLGSPTFDKVSRWE